MIQSGTPRTEALPAHNGSVSCLGLRSAGWFSITVPAALCGFCVFCRRSDAPDRPAWLDRRLTSRPELRRAHRPVL